MPELFSTVVGARVCPLAACCVWLIMPQDGRLGTLPRLHGRQLYSLYVSRWLETMVNINQRCAEFFITSVPS